MSIIKTITLEKRRSHLQYSHETIASVEFSPEKFSVALSTADHHLHSMRPNGAEEAWFRERQINEVAHRITGSIQREISEALSRLDAVVRNGEAITLRVAR